MSELDDILEEFNWAEGVPEVGKQQIKDLYIDIAHELSIELKADIPYSRLVEEIEKQ